MINDEILFIYGAPRSGTTFVNALVRDYFDYGLCAEGDFVLTFKRKLAKYGDLESKENLNRIISDICEDRMLEHFRSVYSRHVGRSVDVQPDDVLANLSEATFPGIIYAVFLSVAQQLNKQRVGNKNPDFYRCLPQLLEWFPNAKFLNVVRDGRDVALSTMKEEWGENSVFACAKKWATVAKAAATFEADAGQERCLTLHYEELLTSPRLSFEKLDEFLNTRISPASKDAFTTHIESGGMRQNFGKWKQQMSSDDLNIFETVTGDWLTHYGYDRAVESPSMSFSARFFYTGQEFLRRFRARLT